MLEEFFQKLGLTNNEQTVYIFLLKHGYCIASVLAKRLNIKRVTAYAILGSLENGLVATFRKTTSHILKRFRLKITSNLQ